MPSSSLTRSPIDTAKGHEVVWDHVSALFAATRRMEGTSYLYFIGEYEDDGPIKIGVAKDPIKRLRTMQTGNPRRLRVEYILLGDMATEKLLHEFWEPFAICSASKRGKVDAPPGTEWFRSEVREQLFPIVETAYERHVDLLDGGGKASFEAAEQIVREAHAEHGFVPKRREEVRVLARGAGYVLKSRPSRI